MLKYSYKCDSCNHECTQEHERGDAPRTQECTECEGSLRRLVKLTSSADISSEDGSTNDKSKKLRKNLKGRAEKMKEFTADKQAEINKWSKTQTGGRW